MHPNQQTVERFYQAFAQLDADTMAACYAPDVVFEDEVFQLNGQREVETPPVAKPQTKTGGIDWGARPVPAPLPVPETRAPRESSTRGSIRDREPPPAAEQKSSGGWLSDILGGGGGRRQSVGEAAIKSVTRSVSSTIGREIGRSILGSILGGKRR